ncbi:MAG: hypothetical protein AAFR74_07680, partial [Pseudomonadota bacterium]
DRMLQPRRKAGITTAFVLDAPGLSNQTAQPIWLLVLENSPELGSSDERSEDREPAPRSVLQSNLALRRKTLAFGAALRLREIFQLGFFRIA